MPDQRLYLQLLHYGPIRNVTLALASGALAARISNRSDGAPDERCESGDALD